MWELTQFLCIHVFIRKRRKTVKKERKWKKSDKEIKMSFEKSF